MTETRNHGTGWSETEALLDVIVTYNSWDGKGAPDFSSLQRRLRDKFEDNELIALETVTDALGKFVSAELARREYERGRSTESP